MQVLVAMPLIDRDAALVDGWGAGVAAVAAAHPEAQFIKCAAVRSGDDAAQRACKMTGVEIVTVPWYATPTDKRHNYDGVMLKRIRLMREAVERGANIIWYIDADIQVQPAHWVAMSNLFAVGHPVVVIPYAVRWAGGTPAVCTLQDSKLSLHDARQFQPADPNTTSMTIAGGGFGCTALVVAVAAAIPFSVKELALSSGGYVCGEDIGWFLNAMHAGIKVRMPLGLIANHLGCETPPERANSGALAS